MSAKKKVKVAASNNKNDKMAECMSSHSMMHNLFGIGLGITIVSLVPSFNNLVVGIIVIGVALALDAMRK